ncbi:MAG: hypothetical protein L6R45_10545 [Anaerolineae bacterium]|nr:hypothetical protein [Anaerolineae bacterium]
MRRWLNPDYGLLLALLLPLFAIIPLLTHAGLPNTADGPAHLMRQVELNQAWQEGNFYPRWGRDLAFGHGMPIFSYAPPALYQLTQLFHLSGLPLDAAMKAVLVFDFLLYSLGMFLFARRLFGPYPALVAAALYVYAPYRLRESYIQGNYGQFTGLAFYPLILWAFHGLITTRRPGYLVAAAVTLAGLLFSHNISFMLFAPMFGAYLLFLLILTPGDEARTRGGEDTRRRGHEETRTRRDEETKKHTTHQRKASPWDAPRTTLHISRLTLPLAALLLGLGLAAIFWLPAFGERHEIQLAGITRGFFDFRENFISLSEFFAPPFPLDLAAINPEFPLSLGLPQIIGAGIGLVCLLLVSLFSLKKQASQPKNQPEDNRSPYSLPPTPYSLLHALFFAFFLFLYTFLALPQSQPLWEAIPLLELAEFPWRMLGPAIFCASLIAAFGFTIYDLRFTIYKSPGSQPHTAKPNSNFLFLFSNFHLPSSIFYPPSSILYLLAIFLTIALNAYYLYPSQFIVWGTPGPADAFAYEVTSGAIGTTSTGEFLPRHAHQHPQPDALWPDYAAGRPPQKIDPATLPPGATVETIARRAESDTFRINTPQDFIATVRTLYWPGWQVYLNGQPIPFTVTDPTGLIQFPLPAGDHTLTLQLESTPLRTTGQWLTLLSAATLIIISAFGLKRTSKAVPQPSPISNLHARRPISAHFFALTTALLVIGYLLSRPLAPLFTLQSNPDHPQPAEQALQANFGTGQTPLLRLVGADNLPRTVQISPGSEAELTTTLYWRALQELDTNYAVFLHLDTPGGQTLATADERHPENIPTRNWPPGLYLRNPLHLQIPPGLPPIRYELNTGLYDPQTQQRLTLLPGEATTYRLGFIWLTPPQPALPPTPLAHFGPDITLWQGDFSADPPTLTLSWQTDRALQQDDTIFVHLLDAQGQLLTQADGAPYEGLYPLSHWLPGQIITDARPLPDTAGLASIAVGIYSPITGQRLPAADAAGQPLPDNRLLIPVKP